MTGDQTKRYGNRKRLKVSDFEYTRRFYYLRSVVGFNFNYPVFFNGKIKKRVFSPEEKRLITRYWNTYGKAIKAVSRGNGVFKRLSRQQLKDLKDAYLSTNKGIFILEHNAKNKKFIVRRPQKGKPYTLYRYEKSDSPDVVYVQKFVPYKKKYGSIIEFLELAMAGAFGKYIYIRIAIMGNKTMFTFDRAMFSKYIKEEITDMVETHNKRGWKIPITGVFLEMERRREGGKWKLIR